MASNWHSHLAKSWQPSGFQRTAAYATACSRDPMGGMPARTWIEIKRKGLVILNIRFFS